MKEARIALSMVDLECMMMRQKGDRAMMVSKMIDDFMSQLPAAPAALKFVLARRVENNNSRRSMPLRV